MHCPDCGAIIPQDSTECPECGATMGDFVEMNSAAPRGDTERRMEVPFELRSVEAGDGLTLEGYAAVFNSPTTIRDSLGEFTETIAAGAFKHTIRNSRPVMQFDHGQHPLIGSLPIASIRGLKEDARGLHVIARVFDNWLTEPLRDAIREQAVRGMSFRFSVVKDTWDDANPDLPTRTLNEVKLYELGPVVHPAYADTTVALRSLARVVPSIYIASSDPKSVADEVSRRLAASLGSSSEPAAPAVRTNPPAVDPAESQSAGNALYPSVVRNWIETLRLAS